MPSSETSGQWPAQPAPPPASASLLFLLVALTAAAPVALQIYLPALPTIARHFQVSTGVAQYTLSLSILANAIATLAYGPLSDRFGRRPVLLAGLLLFAAGSVVATVAVDIWTMIIARIVQAAGAAAGMVLSRAIIRDLYDTEQAARMIAYLTMAMVVAPMISPTIGAILVDISSWRSVFLVLTLFAVGLLAWTWRSLAETRPVQGASRGGSSLVQGAAMLFRRPLFVSYNLQSTFAICTFFAFLAGAPYYMINILGRSTTEYGLYFMLVSGCYMVGNFLSARLVRRLGIHRLVTFGSSLALAANLGCAAWMLSGDWTPITLFGPMALVAIGNGLSIPNAVAGSMSVNRELAGTASGVVGFTQMSCAAIVSQLVGELQNGTPYPMMAFMCACALLSLVCYLSHLFVGVQRRPPTPPPA